MASGHPPVARPAGQQELALTIDDGPSASTPALLAILRSAGAKATFFLSGERMRRFPHMAAKILADGHAVYAHGMDHVPLDRHPPRRIADDMGTCESWLAGLRPTPSPYLVRLPYAAGRRLPWVHRAIRQWSPDAQIAHWSASTDDHAIAGLCSRANEIGPLCQRQTGRVLAQPGLSGSVILMHDEPIGTFGPYVSAITLTVAELLVDGLSRQGYAFETLAPIADPPLLSRFLLEK